MASKVVMAQLSPTMEEGRLVEWKVSEGDEVNQGDVVAEIETDKANMDVEAMGSGVLREIVVEEGATVPVGTLIGVIGEPDEDISDLLEEVGAGADAEPAAEGAGEPAGESQAPAEGTEETQAAAGAPSAEAPAPEAGEERREPEEERAAPAPEEDAAPAGRPAAGDGRVRVSPVARRMAEEAGLDVARIRGSGPSDRVIKRDVEAAIEEREAAPARPAQRAPAAGRLEAETVEASQMRKAIARRLTQSLGPVPHFFLTVEIDMGRLLELRAELNEGRGGGSDGQGGEGASGGGGGQAALPKIGVNDLLLKATAAALARHPEVNASWDDGSIRRHGSVDLGIAVAVEEGLITPVLRDAEAKGLGGIAREAGELVRRARSRDLAPEEYQGATFSVSNLGMFGIDEFTAVINPPESGILAVGRTQEKPVAVDGEVQVRRRMRATMSCDHRVVDGAMGARFLETWTGMLENPLEMLL